MSQARKKLRQTWRRLHPSPIAVALDGTVMANVRLYDGIHDAEAAIRPAVEHGGRVFIGIELDEDQVDELRRWLDDAAYEGLAFALGATPKRRRRKAAREE